MKLFSVLIVSFLTMSYASMAQSISPTYKKDILEHRKNYVKALVKDERAPISSKKEAKNISFYNPDENYIVKCLFIGASKAKPFQMSTYSGEKKPYIKYGELLFEIPGKGTHRLSVYQSLKAMKIPAYKDHLFIPFKDLTSGEETYGGGRYIDLRKKDIEKGMVHLDFNKAYNPWCAYGDGFSCPIPPGENNLKIAIEAGELSFEEIEEDNI